jgi:hypothetical protein
MKRSKTARHPCFKELQAYQTGDQPPKQLWCKAKYERVGKIQDESGFHEEVASLQDGQVFHTKVITTNKNTNGKHLPALIHSPMTWGYSQTYCEEEKTKVQRG